MNNKKLGVTIFAISVVLLIIFITLAQSLNQEGENMGCFKDPGCQQIESSLSLVHFAFGIFGFLFALGFYLFFFSKGEEAIVKRLETDTTRKLSEEKFSILLKGMDEFERKAMRAIREQDGITQSTLRLRVDMSKAKLSQVLASLEKKGLIRREQEKKTLAIYLKENI
jgi:uncharacterized membrane protein